MSLSLSNGPLTRTASRSDLSPQAGRGEDYSAASFCAASYFAFTTTLIASSTRSLA